MEAHEKQQTRHKQVMAWLTPELLNALDSIVAQYKKDHGGAFSITRSSVIRHLIAEEAKRLTLVSA